MLGRSLGFLAVLAACKATPPDPQPEPFPEDTDDAPVTFGSTTTFPLDTGFGEPQDDTPESWLHATHVGNWTLYGTPYSSLTGSLTILEIVDELEDSGDLPDCQAELSMTGVLPEGGTGCGECDFVFDVEFVLVSGDLGSCRLPDLPHDGATWRMGYSSSERAIFVNYQGTGVYVPWYTADQQGDTVLFNWTIDLGVEVEEEE